MEHEFQISTIYLQWYWGSIGLSQIESKCTMIKITTWTKSCRLKPCFGALAGLINTSGWRRFSRIKLPAMDLSHKDLSSLRRHIESSHLKPLRLQEMRASADVLPAVGNLSQCRVKSLEFCGENKTIRQLDKDRLGKPCTKPWFTVGNFILTSFTKGPLQTNSECDPWKYRPQPDRFSLCHPCFPHFFLNVDDHDAGPIGNQHFDNHSTRIEDEDSSKDHLFGKRFDFLLYVRWGWFFFHVCCFFFCIICSACLNVTCRLFHHYHPSQQTSSLPFCRRIVGNIAHWMCFVSDQNRGIARHRENSWTTCSGPCSVCAASKFFGRFTFLFVGWNGNGWEWDDSFVRGKTPKVPLLDSLGFHFTMEEGTSWRSSVEEFDMKIKKAF